MKALTEYDKDYHTCLSQEHETTYSVDLFLTLRDVCRTLKEIREGRGDKENDNKNDEGKY